MHVSRWPIGWCEKFNMRALDCVEKRDSLVAFCDKGVFEIKSFDFNML